MKTINSVEWYFYIAREPLTQQLKNDCWQKLPSCIAGKRNTETITLLYLKNRESQNLDERSVLYQSKSLPLDDSIFISPRTLGMWTQQFDIHGLVFIAKQRWVCVNGGTTNTKLWFSVFKSVGIEVKLDEVKKLTDWALVDNSLNLGCRASKRHPLNP